ncbi:MAG: hypothetical protein H7Y86_11105 [Rhizobacter sp.]|nr:hypothetical protein [Ferruginibacter sp.]
MQIKQLFFGAILSFFFFTSCSKEEAAPIEAAVAIVGKWVGKSSVLSEPYNNHFSFRIHAGGILERIDANGQKTGEGTWAFYSNDEAITGSYTLTGGEAFSIIANFDKYTGELDGTWGTGTQQYGGGYWYMKKVE